MNNFLETLEQRVLIGDGAMGTQLQLAGLEPGDCGDVWSVDHPERVLKIQRAYAGAGSDCLITNTFGACRIMLARHGLGDRVVEINQAAARVAREAFDGRQGFVLGDLGPFGGMMEPYGDTKERDVRDAFREQAGALVEAGVDSIIIETQTSLEEIGIAIEAAREVGAPCVIASMSFDVVLDGADLRTMMGVSPERAAEFIQNAGANLIGTNCGTGIDMKRAAEITRRYRASCDLPVMAQPNAGQPELEEGKVVYRETPAEMASGVPDLVAAGAKIVGACCGSTPEHIGVLKLVISKLQSSAS